MLVKPTPIELHIYTARICTLELKKFKLKLF